MSRRTLVRALPALAVMPVAGTASAAVPDRVVRFGLTPVVVQENLQFFNAWRRYLEERIGRPLRFVQRRSYREIIQLLEAGEIDFAWICGYPFVRRRETDFLDLLAVPVFDGQPLYRSYVIVHRDSAVRGLAGLAGCSFAFSDPDSNSGYLAPRGMLQRMGHAPEQHFRLTFFTYNHAETVEAVADRFADGGAVDSYVWEYLARTRPELTGQTRVIEWSEPFGFPPLVARRGSEPALVARMRSALLDMSGAAEGRRLLKDLALDGFREGDAALYDGIRALAAWIGDKGGTP
ncbi:MAG TPA: phosphate/phosphite/phosphonate ABC transporter substrate-binding protein [Azospirillum sp.]|nr:phosphate/phosphite/phosphonate ABC transporter substrate-binding protein [Azospirillum sp.]